MWYLVGQAGKALDATPRTLESLKAVNGRLRFESLGPDVLTWTTSNADLAGSDTILPEVGQTVALYQGDPAAGGVRRFFGWAVKGRRRKYQSTVEVQGPWWWMQRTDLTSVQTDQSGGTAERSSYVFPETSPLDTHIVNLINRMIAMGVPVVRGAVSSMFPFCRITLSLMSYADALAEMVRIVPDSVVWFDYSGAGLPILNVYRRSALTNTTWPVTDLEDDLDLSPRTELVTSEVALHYVERNPTTGKGQFKTQSSGSGGAGTRQILEVSGPVLDTFLPPDDFDSFTIQTVAASSPGSAAFKGAILKRIPEIVAARNANSGSPVDAEVLFGDGTAMGPYYSNSGFTPGQNANPAVMLQPPTFLDANGNVVSPSGKYLLVGDAPPDWATNVSVQKVTMSGEIGYEWIYERFKFPYGAADNSGTENPPAWYESIGWTERFYYKLGSGTYNHWYVCFGRLTYKMEVYLTTASYPGATKLYKPPDYSFITPPANLAANLRNTQNFLPWEGVISRKGAAYTTGENLLTCKFNVSGLTADEAGMGAMPKAVEYSLENLTQRIELGAPARYDFATLVQRLRRTPQDNIVFI